MATDTPTYPQYTNRQLGDGLFDQLMGTVEHHLKKEFDAQRISGDQYAKTYMGSMEAVLANTTQYLLGILLIDEKAAQIELQNELIELQKEELRYKIDYLYPLEVLKAQAEVDLINAQIDKINKEIEFLTAKIATEVANVDGTGVLDDSVIGRQMELLRAQKLGFAGDLEAKTAKLHADYAAVFQSVQEVPEDAALNSDAQSGIERALQTAEEIKDAAYSGTPLAPTSLVAVAFDNSQIDLTWTDNDMYESSYVIERETVPGSFSVIDTIPGGSEAYSDTTCSPTTEYNYRVKAVREGGAESAYSNVANETTPA